MRKVLQVGLLTLSSVFLGPRHHDPTYFHTYEVTVAREIYASILIARSNTIFPQRVTVTSFANSYQLKLDPVYQDGSGCVSQKGALTTLASGSSTADVETGCSVQPNSNIGDNGINEIIKIHLPANTTQSFTLTQYSATAGHGFAVETENSITDTIAVTWEWNE